MCYAANFLLRELASSCVLTLMCFYFFFFLNIKKMTDAIMLTICRSCGLFILFGFYKHMVDILIFLYVGGEKMSSLSYTVGDWAFDKSVTLGRDLHSQAVVAGR